MTIKRVKSVLIGRPKELNTKKCSVVLKLLYKVILMIHQPAVSVGMSLIFDVDTPQNDVVPVSAGAHLSRVSK